MTVDTRLYVINTYTSFGAEDQETGTENNRMPDMAKGMHMRSSQGLAFPNLDFVLSTITPMMMSLIPSKNLETIIMLPTAKALTPA